MDPSKLIEGLKLPPRIILGIVIFLGLILLGPDALIAQIGLIELRDQLRPWIGAAFVLAVSLLSVHVFAPVSKSLAAAITRRRLGGAIAKRLRKLTPDEKLVLRAYVENETRTRYWGIDNGVIRGLESTGILYRASNVSSGKHYGDFAFNVGDWAWEILTKHPDLVQE